MAAMRANDPTGNARPSRVHLGPGEIWTGQHRYACDGAIVRLSWTRGDPPRIESVIIEQLHDINVARHRRRSETREHLRRCLKLMTREGLIIRLDGEPHVVRAEAVRASPRLTLHAFHRAEHRHGPFHPRPSGE